ALNKASEVLPQALAPVASIYRTLALAEERNGNYFRYLRYLRMSMEGFTFPRRYGNATEHWPNARLAIGYAAIGDVRTAEVALEEAARRFGRADALTAPT